jgi:hypothetical protein
MIPYELDPSLHTAKPHEPALDDGFSPPPDDDALTSPAATTTSAEAPVDPALWAKSAF